MRQTRHRLRAWHRSRRELRVILDILRTRNTYGYNSVLERILSSLAAAGSGIRTCSVPRRRGLVVRP